MKHQKIVRGADGKENYTSADSAKPGDVIEYKAVYRNKGKKAATNLLATIPVPLGTDYLTGSAKPAKLGSDSGLSAARRFRQHLLDLDRDPVAVDQHHAAGNRQVVGEDFDLVRLGGVQFNDGAAAEPHYLMDGHRGGAQDDHEVNADFFEGWHWVSDLN